MRPYYEDGSVTIYHGDCLEVQPGPYEVVLSDPPWGISVAVDNARFSGGNQTRTRASVGERIPVHGDDGPFDPLP